MLQWAIPVLLGSQGGLGENTAAVVAAVRLLNNASTSFSAGKGIEQSTLVHTCTCIVVCRNSFNQILAENHGLLHCMGDVLATGYSL